MKSSVITFKKPVKILQVFSNIVYYRKEEKSFDLRKEKLERKPAASVQGGIVNGQLFLPESLLAHPRLFRCHLISMVDDQTTDHYHIRDFEYNDCLVLDVPRPFGVFDLANKKELELHLRHNPLSTEIPQREGFKISDLRPGEPVEVKINGKYDFSLFGSPRARVFKEQQYIFQHYGEFTSFQVFKQPIAPIHKSIPEKRKLVDLLKPLW